MIWYVTDSIVYSLLVTLFAFDWLIDWLLEFNAAREATIQLYSGDEHELGDKIKMIWWWNEKWGVTQG